jgi:uncharacterized membrane protein
MNAALTVSATLLHLLATVTLIGLYLLTFFVITPAATQPGYDAAQVGVLLGVYKRAKPPVLVAWLLFAASGIYLTLADSQYEGIGQFNNAWSLLMLAKHVVVAGMILMSGFINACPAIGLMRPLEAAVARNDARQFQELIPRLRARERIMAVLGLIVLLLTAVAEAA